VLAGSNTTFTVTAYGAPTLAYQWRLNGTNIGGATRASFTVTNAQPTNAGSYSVTVTNLAGTAVSSNAALVVNAPAYVTAPITNQTVQLSRNALFVVAAAGTAPLAYQWYRGVSLLTGQTASSFATHECRLGPGRPILSRHHQPVRRGHKRARQLERSGYCPADHHHVCQ